MTLNEMLEESAGRYPERVALIFEKRRITYRSLNEDTNKIAHSLIELGVEKGEKVGILLTNSPEFVVSYFAILKAGGTVVPLNNLLKVEELRYILEDSQASILITSPQFWEMIKKIRARLGRLKNSLIVGRKEEGTLSFEEELQREPSKPLSRNKDPEKVAVILYTSGTTGHPKGAMLSHRNLLSNVLACLKVVEAGAKDNFLCLLPMFHSFTYTVCVLIPLYLGARLTIIASLRPFRKVIKNIVRNRVTIFVAIPAVYKVLADIRLPRILTSHLLRLFNPLRLCVSGASPLSTETLKKFEEKFCLPLLEGYGLSETSPVVSLNPLKGMRKPGSVGLPLPGVGVKVVDEEGTELPPGGVGELLVRGANVMKGYYDKPEETKEVLKEGWLFTGDLAKLDEDGYIYIVDRKKDMLLVRGLNVYPREVEEVLYSHPQVAEAAVIGMKDELRGEAPLAYITLKEGEEVSESEITKYCRERLANYKVPKKVLFRDQLPKTSTGKILKIALRKEAV